VKLLGKDSRHIKAFVINKFRAIKESAIDSLADMVRENTDMAFVKEICGI
jgi:hypothetical protein